LTAVNAIVSGNLPPPGAVIAGAKSLCDECKRVKSDKPSIKRYFRPQEIIPEPEKCLLEQGIMCMGCSTRSGCGALCTGVNMPCRGCYGPLPGSTDVGADMTAAAASILEESGVEAIEEKIAGIADPLGTFYRFTLPVSLLGRTARKSLA
jgi:F420-non-reducing hydrogenase small subunit